MKRCACDTYLHVLGRLIATILIIICMTPCKAAYARELRAITTTDGLGDNLVNTIYKDAAGFIWLGTGSSLDRFDGNAVKTYRFPGADALLGRVSSITGTPDGTIYIANRQGLYRLPRNSDAPEPLLADVITFPVNALRTTPDGRIVAGTIYGLYIYDPATDEVRHKLLAADMLSSDNQVTDIHPVDADRVWLLTPSRLINFDIRRGKMRSYDIPSATPASSLGVADRKIYIGTRGSGVIPFDSRTATFGPPIAVGNDIVSAIDVDSRSERIYIATDGEGVFRYHIPSATLDARYTSEPSDGTTPRLRSNSVYSLLIDDHDLLWIGYYQSGVDYTPFIDNLFEVYSRPGLIDTYGMTVRAIASHADGEMLLGTRQGLLYINENTGQTALTGTPRMRSNMVFCTLWAGGRYYVGTYGGGMYTYIPPGHVSDFDARSVSLTRETVFDIKPDPAQEGGLWVGTSAGLFRFDAEGRETAHFTSTNSQLPQGNVYEIFFDSHGRGWVGTENGMVILSDGIPYTDRFPAGFCNTDKIRHVFEADDGSLYFVPDRGPVVRTSARLDKVERLDMGGLSSASITFATQDSDHAMWFGSEKGLVRCDSTGHMHIFNVADGLPHPSFTLCQPVFDSKGDMWLGNSLGLVKLDMGRLRSRVHVHSPFYVTDVEANGHSAASRIATAANSDVRSLTLPGDENNVTFHFSNFQYSEPQYTVAQYRLNGYDKDWRLMEGNNPLYYYDLPPGEYTLELRCPGMTSTTTLFSIRIKRSVNTATLLLAILALGAAATAVWIYRVHRRRMSRQQQADEARSQAAQDTDATLSQPEKIRYRTTRLSDEECRRLFREIERVMKSARPFTDPDLKSARLAEMVGATAHELSFLFNQYLGQSYYDYINRYRVEEFKRIVKESDADRYTLTALSQKCGFSSRASFFRHFKTMTGITPAEYIKGLR